MITCVRLPHFAANVLRREHRTPISTPVVGIKANKVTATDALAVEAGVMPGLTQRQAKAMLPEGAFLASDEACTERVLKDVLDSLLTFTPLAAYDQPPPGRRKTASHKPGALPHYLDASQSAIFYLDLEGLNLAASRQLAGQIGPAVQEATGLAAALGLGRNRFTAFAAAQASQPAQVTVVEPGQEAAFLSELSVKLLPTDLETVRRLHLLGLTRLGQVAALPLSALLMQFGAAGFLFHRLANGQDESRVVPQRAEVVEQVLCEFDAPLNNLDQVEAVIRQVAVELAARLQAKGCMGRTLSLTLYLEDRSRIERRRSVRQAVSGTTQLSYKLLQLLESVKSIPRGVVGVEAVVSQVIPFAGQQLDLFIHQANQRERLEATLGELKLRYDTACFLWVTPANTTARRIEQRYRLETTRPMPLPAQSEPAVDRVSLAAR